MNQENPIIVTFVDDLMWETRIEQSASRLHFAVRNFGTESELVNPATNIVKGQPGEPTSGRYAELIDKLTQWQPALLIFDLTNSRIPWREWLSILKTSPATRRIPAICFAPHVESDLMREANDRGADQVLVRSRFAQKLTDLIEKWARTIDEDTVFEDCASPLSPNAIKGIEAYNAHKFFESHEYLEEAWNEDQSSVRDMYRGIIQVAVACLQIERRNYAGAVKLFLRARQWLQPFPPVCRGINITRLRDNAEKLYVNLLELGSSRIGDFDLGKISPIEYSPAEDR